MNEKFLIIDNTNFIDFPTGGTLSFDKQLLKVIPETKVAIVGLTTGDHIVGEWTTVEIDGMVFDFFPFMKVLTTKKKPLIPLRVTSLIALLKNLKKIREKGHLNIFTQTPQFLFAFKYFTWQSICFCFAGVGNSIALSRYRLLRFLGSSYEKALFAMLNSHVDVILAAADRKAIQELTSRSEGLIHEDDILSFPTRYDDLVFKPIDQNESRKELGLPEDKTILVAVGRLCWIKGWDLLLEMMAKKGERNLLLVFVGDGEDRKAIEDRAKELIHSKSLFITGFQSQDKVSKYINSSDLLLVGSYQEGWSTAMVEAIACGKPIVSTNVSGASELIKEGENGFILQDRNPYMLLDFVDKALEFENAKDVSLSIAQKYSLTKLYDDLVEVWPSAGLKS